MKKPILSMLICLPLVLFLTGELTGEMTKAKNLPRSAPKVAEKQGEIKIIAYYFHGNKRCYTCRKIEQYSKEAIDKNFAKELTTKQVIFQPINLERPENQHYIRDYQLHSKSLVIVRYRDNRQEKWKILQDVWIHVHNQEKFFQYVKDEIDNFLRETV